MRPTRIRAPRHLSPEAKAFYRHVVSSFDLDRHHVLLLVSACEALDRVREARLAMAETGVVIKNRFGIDTPSPWCRVERDNRVLFARLLRELCLSDEASEPRLPRMPSY